MLLNGATLRLLEQQLTDILITKSRSGFNKEIMYFFKLIIDYFFRSFAVWRVDPPWKAVSLHGQGKKLGGGKGDIAYYTTPVKRGRIIVEIGGVVPPILIDRALIDVAQKLPFPAKMVSQQDIENWEAEDKLVKEKNLNQLRWEWCVKNNILNCLNYLGKYDIEFSHLGPDVR